MTFSNSAVNYTVNGTAGIAGATGITMNGAGVVFLQNGNSFTGPVAINAGVINISNSGALGLASIATVAAGAALQIQGGITTAAAVPLVLNGAGLASNPAGALDNVSGANTYSGAITLASASAIAATAGTLTLSGPVAASGYPLTIGGGGAIAAAGAFTADGGLTVNAAGGGTLTLGGADSTLGGGDSVNINQGTLAVAGGNVNITNALNMGNSGVSSDTPAYNQTAGTVAANANGLNLGNAAGTGLTTFTISGGNFTTTGTMNVASRSDAVVNVSGGSLSVGVLLAGNYAGGTGVINVSSGNFTFGSLGGYAFLGAANGARGVLNISGGTTTFATGYMGIGGESVAAAGAINQSGGVFNMGGAGAILGWNNGPNAAYGGYTLSAGTLNMPNTATLNLGNAGYQGFGLFSQSGGVANIAGSLLTGIANYGLGAGVIDVSGGSLTVRRDPHGARRLRHARQRRPDRSRQRLSSVAEQQVLRVGLRHGDGHREPDHGRDHRGQPNPGAGGTSTINFDGGTLRVYSKQRRRELPQPD